MAESNEIVQEVSNPVTTRQSSFLFIGRTNLGILQILERADRVVTTVVSPIATSGLGVLCLYYVAVSYGFLVIGVIGGRQSLARLITNTTMNPMLIVIGVPMIPVSLVMLEALDIEDRTLHLWRHRISPRLSRVPVVKSLMEYLWPKLHRVPIISKSTGFIGTIDYLTRSITGGLMLPFMGYLIGKYAFKNTRHTNFQKVIIGSLIFYLLKTTVKVYLKQQQYRRQGFRRVLDYDHSNDGRIK